MFVLLNTGMFNIVTNFEKEIAKFYNAPYAVATDCCTHAVELSLRYTNAKNAYCPTHTYLSIPMTFIKLGLDWGWSNILWQDYYFVTGDIVDAAVYWEQDSYIPNTFMCLSFQFKKHLSLGRGGAILCSTKEQYIELKKMSYDGRLPDSPWADQNINSLGYHYYMTPETAQLGLDKLPNRIATPAVTWTWEDYPDLTTMELFK
jgi:dTDP-4-amino-4,6-dideoxygalactose transaminase